jgi:hypothetical protein
VGGAGAGDPAVLRDAKGAVDVRVGDQVANQIRQGANPLGLLAAIAWPLATRRPLPAAMARLSTLLSLDTYDLVVVGSGNGACAYLHHYLPQHPDQRVLVLEEGSNFFETSDITHQRNWTRSYAESDIFLLHRAQTPDGLPILSGRACAMGGGGSINYTMIYESCQWLAERFGHGESYWEQRQRDLAEAFHLLDPSHQLTAVASHVRGKLLDHGFLPNEVLSGGVPVYQDGAGQRFHLFPTQFDAFGQRVHSGVSLLSWSDNPQIDLLCEHRVTALCLETVGDDLHRCVALRVCARDGGEERTLTLAPRARLLLCAGAATPQLLLPHRDTLANPAIGRSVNDHILLPFGLYLLPPDLEPTGKDQYVSLFATSELSFTNADGEGARSVGNIDFFSGPLPTLLYLVSHLFLAFWVPNGLKRQMIQRAWLFQLLKRVTRLMVSVIDRLLDLLWCLLHPRRFGRHRWPLIAAIVKFSIVREGVYVPEPSASEPTILLRCFQADANGERLDARLAEQFLADQLPMVSALGQRPHPLIEALIRLLTRMPYTPEQIPDFVAHYRRHDLLTEQHLAGGCLLGEALDLGLETPAHTGRVKGSANIFVADLSASPLPRVSPQMTAYLIGHHVAVQHSLDEQDLHSLGTMH